MLENFFIYGEIPLGAIKGEYDPGLVVLSYIIAFLGSYAGLSLASNMYEAKNWNDKDKFQFAGAMALGAGIWAMHFIGMIAYRMDMVHSYNPWLTFLSMMIAITVAYCALWVTRAHTLRLLPILAGAVLLGVAICAMHYVGMVAMTMRAALYYIPSIFALSVTIAIGASVAALIIIFFLGRHQGKSKLLLRILASLIMALAISGMHYTGMAAAVILPYADCRFDPNQDFTFLIAAVTVITGLIFGLCFLNARQELWQNK